MSGKKVADIGTRFGIEAPDMSHSSVWRVWSNKADVYAAPRFKAGDFKFSFHQVCWRFAFTKQYAAGLDQSVIGIASRTIDDIPVPRRNPAGFLRLLRIAFPTNQLRKFDEGWRDPKRPVIRIPAAGVKSVRFVDVIKTDSEYTIPPGDWPLRWSVRTELVATWSLDGGDRIWVVHFERDEHERIQQTIDEHLATHGEPQKLDSRPAPKKSDKSGRILLQYVGCDLSMRAIDAALPEGLIQCQPDD